MKLAYPDFGEVFHWEAGAETLPTLVLENQSLFRRFIKDLSLASDGADTPVVLSRDDSPIDFSKYAEVLFDFVRFSCNQKPLLNKICTALEHNALSPDRYVQTQTLLADIERTVGDWAFDFPCDIVATKISVSALLKAIGIEINESYEGEYGEAERIIDYMELVREFDRDKLFITVNMRCFFPDEVTEAFMKTALAHEYRVLMIESKSYPMLSLEKRWTVDEDLCEF